MNPRHLAVVVAAAFAFALPLAGRAQSLYQEDFTGATTTNPWFFFNGACLTAGTSTSTASPGTVPGCVTVFNTYYGVANSSTGKPADGAMVGGYAGYMGASSAPGSGQSQVADPILSDANGNALGGGALRFTNGYPYGYHENGAIVSAFTVPSGQGIEITFKTTTYLGDSGGGGKDGADGISFYLLDGCMPIDGGAASGLTGAGVPSGCSRNAIYGTGNTFPAIGAWGGSLAYTCSNVNQPFHGLTGAYLGLGIDEYGNFLNGTTNTLSESGTSATGDNTASGGGYQPGRIGLRGAGSVSWNALTTAYGSNPNSSTSPYYPSSLITTCSNGGTYNSSTGTCGAACSAGSYNSSTNTCDVCPSGYTFSSTANTCGACNSGGTYDPNTNSCSNPAYTCPTGSTYDGVSSCTPQCSSGSFNSSTNACNVCSSGQTFDLINALAQGQNSANPCAKCKSSGATYSTSTGTCSTGNLSWKSPSSTSSPNTPVSTLITQSSTTANLLTGKPIYTSAVQKTCSTGHLWNYSNPAAPTDAGPATLPTDPNTANANNTAGILDYPAIPGAYSVLSGVQIANETAQTRSGASPILYDVKITQDGLLSFSYSTNGTNYTSVIKQQQITASNGPLPGFFRFGFAGSTGGSTNVHEIECFKAAPATQSASSTTVDQKQSAKITPNQTQAYFAYYNPTNNTGTVTANYLEQDSSGNIFVKSAANWDASCVLTGTAKQPSGVCPTSGVASAKPLAPTSRVMLTWDDSQTPAQGIPFEWANLNSSQRAAIDNLDASQNGNRTNYLRGDTTNEVNSVGTGQFRSRDAILGDIIDSSPAWVGPPNSPYTSKWADALHSSGSTPENAATYTAFVTSYQQRLNVVYTGSNDGFVHGFRSGSFDSAGNFSTTNNDGSEVIAYIPAAVINTIHTVAKNASGQIDGTLDFSSTQYVHNYYVDGPPNSGDLFYASAWHTWLVGGLGPGGAAIYALDVTDPSRFAEANANGPGGTAPLVVGEWNSSIACAGSTATGSSCGANLGKTYGMPQIRRLHDGNWGVIFGNGLNSSTGDAGIFVMVVSQTDGSQTFYYLSTGTQGTGNGIAYVTPADLDGDHITDYVYAGDLKGNVWRFDLTSTSEAQWAASTVSGNTSPTPIFTAPSGQPITSKVAVAAGSNGKGQPQRLMVIFGTGQKFPITVTSAATYASGQQSFYGVWDWNTATDATYTTGSGTKVTLSAWNNQSGVIYAGLSPTNAALSKTNNVALQANLQSQAITVNTTSLDRDISESAVVCWQGSSTCGSGNTQFGWYLKLPGSSEQIIYNPEIVGPAVTVNSIVPANNQPTQCSLSTDTGFTYAVSVMTGGSFNNAFGPTTDGNGKTTYHDTNAGGINTNATGSSFAVTNSAGQTFLVFQTVLNTHGTQQLNLPPNNVANRVTWIQLR